MLLRHNTLFVNRIQSVLNLSVLLHQNNTADKDLARYVVLGDYSSSWESAIFAM